MKLVANTKDTNVEECVMERVNFIIKMEGSMKDNGKITRWMAMANCIMKEVKLHMKDIGFRINLMVWGKFTMTILSF